MESNLVRRLLDGSGDHWFGLFTFIVLFIVLTFAAIGASNIFQKKTFEGYYVKQDSGVMYIMGNWDNREDKQVFKTTDTEKFKEMWKFLNKPVAIGKAGIIYYPPGTYVEGDE